jgi:hypothetical protein
MKILIVFQDLLFMVSAFSQCSQNSDCKGDRICVNGVCTAPPAVQRCTKDNDCPGNMVCNKGKCVQPGSRIHEMPPLEHDVNSAVPPLVPKSSVATTPAPSTPVTSHDSAIPVRGDSSCQESTSQAQADAVEQHRHPPRGWAIGGFFSGALLGIAGTGAITGIAACTQPQPKVSDPVNPGCYKKAYTRKARSLNIWDAFGGGLWGTALEVTIVLGMMLAVWSH